MSYGCKHKDVECTKELVEEVARQLATRSARDTDFQETTDPTKNDGVAIVQDGLNKYITLGNLSSVLNEWLDTAKLKTGTTAYWNASTYQPDEGEIIVYTDRSSKIVNGETVYIPGLKIGGGNAYVQDLAFVDEDIAIALANHINNNIVHITGEERQFWNGKVSIDESQAENDHLLIFKTN